MESPWRWRQRMELHSHKAKDSWSPESWLSKGLSPSLSEPPCRPWLWAPGPRKCEGCVLFEATSWWLVMVAQGH